MANRLDGKIVDGYECPCIGAVQQLGRPGYLTICFVVVGAHVHPSDPTLRFRASTLRLHDKFNFVEVVLFATHKGVLR